MRILSLGCLAAMIAAVAAGMGWIALVAALACVAFGALWVSGEINAEDGE